MRVPVAPPVKPVAITGWPSALSTRATIGSGDAFLAGFVAARYSGRTAADCLAYGVACGAESTQHLGAGLIDPERVARLVGETEVQRLHAPAEIS